MIDAAPSPSRISNLRTRIAALQAHFAEVGRRAARAAAAAKAGGAPPAEELLAELTATATQFQALRDEILDSAATLEIILPDTLRSLRDLTPVVDVLASTLAQGDRQRRHEAGRAAALRVVNRVQAIVHSDDPAFAPLAQCQAMARAMHDEIARSAATEGDVIGWAERLRPFAALLEVLEGGVDDVRVAQLTDNVAAVFGPPLATATVRGRLRLR